MKLNIPVLSSLIIIPGVVIILSLSYLSPGPYYLSMNSDPEYAYLLNSLNILMGKSPTHIDHPGTPLQMLGALVLFLHGGMTVSSFSPGIIQKSVLLNPESYLHAISFVIRLLLFCSMVLSGVIITKTTKTLLPALLFQFSLTCYFSIMLAIDRVSPEPLLIFAAVLLSIPLIFEFIESSQEKINLSNWNPVLAGCAIGFGISLKITFLPVLFFTFFFGSFKRISLAILSTIIAFLLFTLPIISKYLYLFDWIKSIAMHDGMYGHGQLGIPEVGKLITNSIALFSREPLMFFSLFIYLALAIFMSNCLNLDQILRKKIRALLWIACLVITVQIAITAKHPSAHYMIPAMAATCFINSVLIYSLLHRSHRNKFIGPTFLILLFAAFIFNSTQIRKWNENKNKNIMSSNELLSQVSNIKNGLKIGFYRSSLPGYALSFGNEWSGYHYGNILAELYQDTIFYNIWDQFFYSFKGKISKDEMDAVFSRYSNIVFVGSKNSLTSDKNIIVKSTYMNNSEGMYLMLR